MSRRNTISEPLGAGVFYAVSVVRSAAPFARQGEGDDELRDGLVKILAGTFHEGRVA